MLKEIKNKITGNPRISNFLWGVRGLWGDTVKIVDDRMFEKKTRGMIQEFIRQDLPVKKLNIGAGNTPFEGWLNVDVFLSADKTAFMDATKKFPLDSDSFDYIYSEHMIEHIYYDEADFMLKECFRVLKKGGKIRIVTPCLDNLISMRNNLDDPTLIKYIDQLVQPMFQTKIPPHPDYAINYITYNYSHKFIHSKFTLTHLLSSNGFSQIKSCGVFESEDPHLRNLEAHVPYLGEDLYRFEAIILEAQKS